MSFETNSKFQLPTDIKIEKIKISTFLDYKNDLEDVSDIQKKSLIDYLKKNPILKYPLRNDYYVFFNDTVHKLLNDEERLSDEEKNFLKLQSPKYCYENLEKLGDKAMTGILNSPRHTYLYAKKIQQEKFGEKVVDISERRFIEGEKVILKSPMSSFDYINDIIFENLKNKFVDKTDFVIRIIQNKFKDFEDSILKDKISAYQYVLRIINNVYPKAEPIILEDDFVGVQYLTQIVYPQLLKENNKDDKKTRKEIRKRYRDFENEKIINSSKQQYSNDVSIQNYLEIIVKEPDFDLEDKMIKSGTMEAYFIFLKKYYLKQYANDTSLSEEDKFLKVKEDFEKNKHHKKLKDKMSIDFFMKQTFYDFDKK